MPERAVNPSPEAQAAVSRLRMVVQQAAAIAAELERGQSSTPLNDHLTLCGSDLEIAPLSVILVGLDEPSRVAGLEWFCGSSISLARMDDLGSMRLMEIQLASRGYSLSVDGRRSEFEGAESLFDAVRVAASVHSRDASVGIQPMQLSIAAPEGMKGIRILLPTATQALIDNPALRSRLLSQSNLLIIVGPHEIRIEDRVCVAMRDVAAGVWATWTIACGDGQLTLNDDPEWRSVIGGDTLSLWYPERGTGVDAVGNFLSDRFGIRCYLSSGQRAKQLESALAMLEDKIDQDQRQQENRRKAIARRTAELGGGDRDRTLRENADSVRQALEVGLGQIETDIEERVQNRALPTSPSSNRIKNLLDDLCGADIQEERVGRTIRLSLSSEFLSRSTAMVRKMVREDMDDDFRGVAEALAALDSDLRARLAGVQNPPVAMDLTVTEAERTWDVLKEMLLVESRYRGELSAKSWMDRISHGRRPVMLLMMSISIIGAAFGGNNIRAWLAPAIAALFVVGVAWTFRSFREEHGEAIEKELLRLRDALVGELKRLYEQALREWHARLTRQLRELRREALRRLDAQFRAEALQQTQALSQERKELQDRARVVDQRVRELVALSQQLHRVQQATAELLDSLQTSATRLLKERARAAKDR